MNTYRIVKMDSKCKETNLEFKAPNLLTALEKIGLTGIRIYPNWRGRSNGKYTVFANEVRYVECEWVEKINQLNRQ